jgi:hypothetical protein
MWKTLLIVTAAVFSITMLSQTKTATFPIQGVWRVTEVTTTGPNGSTNRSPQPGLIIFTGRHYSMMYVTGAATRADIAPDAVAKATADQLRAMWGPFTANSGTYEVTGSTVTYRQTVAKMPYVMASGNFSTSAFKLDGNTLTLTPTGGRAGPVVNPITTKLTRVE